MDAAYQQWVEGITRLLIEREGLPVMVLIANPHGVECVSNTDDSVIQFGILRAGTRLADRRFDMAIDEWNRNGTTKAMTDAIQHAMDGKVGFQN